MATDAAGRLSGNQTHCEKCGRPNARRLDLLGRGSAKACWVAAWKALGGEGAGLVEAERDCASSTDTKSEGPR